MTSYRDASEETSADVHAELTKAREKLAALKDGEPHVATMHRQMKYAGDRSHVMLSDLVLTLWKNHIEAQQRYIELLEEKLEAWSR